VVPRRRVEIGTQKLQVTPAFDDWAP
jgi:hypothetical protein